MTHGGIDLTALNPAVRPQDDLYSHVNGRWIATHEIPADRAVDGALRALYDQAEEQGRDIITDAEVRDAYRPHIARMLTLGGVAADDAQAAELAGRVIALETKLAAGHWDVVKDRDADLTYNPTTLADLAASAPGFDWNAWVHALGAPQHSLEHLVVREPSFAESSVSYTH